jgi:hypothetical protein
VLGRLVARGLHDELKGCAYAVVEGVDGRTHHLQFSHFELTGDAAPGAIVEARAYEDAGGRKRLSLAIRSDLSLQQQIIAPGATWLDRQLLAREPAVTGGGGFGSEVREAMDRRVEHLTGEGFARPLRARPAQYLTGQRAERRDREDCRRDRTRLSAIGGRRARRWDLPAAGQLELRAVRDDRRWPRFPARSLASGFGTATWSPSLRCHAAEQPGRLELWSKARPRTLTHPVRPTRTIEPCQPQLLQ